MLPLLIMSLMLPILHACLHMICGGVRAIKGTDWYINRLMMYYYYVMILMTLHDIYVYRYMFLSDIVYSYIYFLLWIL